MHRSWMKLLLASLRVLQQLHIHSCWFNYGLDFKGILSITRKDNIKEINRKCCWGWGNSLFILASMRLHFCEWGRVSGVFFQAEMCFLTLHFHCGPPAPLHKHSGYFQPAPIFTPDLLSNTSATLVHSVDTTLPATFLAVHQLDIQVQWRIRWNMACNQVVMCGAGVRSLRACQSLSFTPHYLQAPGGLTKHVKKTQSDPMTVRLTLSKGLVGFCGTGKPWHSWEEPIRI